MNVYNNIDMTGRKTSSISLRKETNMKIIISKTGEIHGRGSDSYKWVSFLTSEERKHVREGSAIVLIPDDNPHHECVPYKRVYFRRERGISQETGKSWAKNNYYHRNASDQEIIMANITTKKKGD